MALAGDWQLECENVEQSCGYLLTSGLWSDCAFVVGSETKQEVIEAHKLVLAMASPVFEAMLYGGLSEDKLTIPDIEPETFRALLQYIYTGDLTINSFDMACDLWLDADKYMLPHLVKKIKNHIFSVVGPSNACRAYELARLFDDKEVMEKCIQIISKKTKEVLKDSSFEDVELNTLITVCSLDHLTVDSEVELFQAVESYAKAEQGREGQSSPPEELPSVGRSSELDSKPPTEVRPSKTKDNKEDLKKEEPSIHTAIQKIRLLSLTAQEFAECPGRSDLLTDKEKLAILMNLASTDCAMPMPPGFSELRERRQPPSNSQEQCFKPASSLDHTVNALKFGSPSQVEQPQRPEPGSWNHTMNELRCGNISWIQVLEQVDSVYHILSTPPDIQLALDNGMLDALVPLLALTEGDHTCIKVHAFEAILYLCRHGSPSQLSALAASAALEPFCRQLMTVWGVWRGNISDYTCNCVLYGLTDLLQKVEQNTKVGLLLKLREIGVPQLLMAVRRGGVAVHLALANNLLRTYFRNKQ